MKITPSEKKWMKVQKETLVTLMGREIKFLFNEAMELESGQPRDIRFEAIKIIKSWLRDIGINTEEKKEEPNEFI
jgi:hypothetical protein